MKNIVKFRASEKRLSGFTLLELLVVIAIIGAIAAIALPAIGSVRKKASATACMNNLRQLYLGTVMFSEDHDGQYPRSYLPCATSHSIAEPEPAFLSDYLDGEKDVVCCPSVKGYYDDAPSKYSYAYFLYSEKGAPSGRRLTYALESRSNTIPVFADSDLPEFGAGENALVILRTYLGVQALPDNNLDLNHDGKINILDMILARNNGTEICDEAVKRHNNFINVVYLDGHMESVHISPQQ